MFHNEEERTKAILKRASSDGYIRQKRQELRRIRWNILAKYSCTFGILLFLLVLLFCLALLPRPEKWLEVEINYQQIVEEYVGIPARLRYVLQTSDGQKFVFNERIVSINEIRKQLTDSEPYTLVYANTVLGGKIIEGLQNSHNILQSREVSVQMWEKDHRGLQVAICATCLLEAVALILIDRIWCRKDHAKISCLKTRMNQRMSKEL